MIFGCACLIYHGSVFTLLYIVLMFIKQQQKLDCLLSTLLLLFVLLSYLAQQIQVVL